MKKIFIFLTIAFLFGIPTQAQIVDNTIDDPGDIVIVAYQNGPDGFSFVFLDNCPNGTSIRFIDEEWNGTAFASEANEGDVLWVNSTGSTIAQGMVVHIENADNDATISASIGTATEDDGGFNLSDSGDGLIAITGTRAIPGNFLAFFGDSSTASNTHTLDGTSLVNQSTANFHTSYGVGYYSGSTDCSGITIEACAARLNTKENWTIDPETFVYPGDVITSVNTSGVLNVSNLNNSTAIQVYPNPFTDILKIVSEKNIQNISVINMFGRVVLEKKGSFQAEELQMQQLKPGIYLLKVTIGTEAKIYKIQKI